MGRPLRQQLDGGHPQRDVRTANLVLGPGDSLPHRRLGLQQRPCDLGHGEPGDQPQRQRQLRRAVQRRMCAREHHPQFVVADRMHVLTFHSCAVAFRDRSEFLARPCGFAAEAVERTVAGDRHDPAARAVGHAVARPRPQRLGECLLDGVLRDVEVTGPARERGHRRTPFASKDAVQVDHSGDGYSPEMPASCRNSTDVAGIIEAILTASSRSLADST